MVSERFYVKSEKRCAVSAYLPRNSTDLKSAAPVWISI
jgi:hypothetical protein